jgi:hypothetical protein
LAVALKRKKNCLKAVEARQIAAPAQSRTPYSMVVQPKLYNPHRLIYWSHLAARILITYFQTKPQAPLSNVRRRFHLKKCYSSWILNTSISCNVTPCSLVVRYKCTDVSEGPHTPTITYFNLDYPPFHPSLFLLSRLFHFIGYFLFFYHSLLGYFWLFHVKRRVDTAPRILRICIRLKFSASFFGRNTPVHDVGCMEPRARPDALVLPVIESRSNEPQAVTSLLSYPECF